MTTRAPTADAGEFVLHAWVDESMHVMAGLYLLAAVVCDPAGCKPVRESMRSLLDVDQPRLHWGTESPERREAIVDQVAQIDMAAVVVIGTPMLKSKQERARAICMESLTVALAGMGVSRVWLEERTPSLNDRDARLVDSIRGKQLIPPQMRINVQKPTQEPMLWLPDIVAGAVGAARVRDQPQYLARIQSMVTEMAIPLR